MQRRYLTGLALLSGVLSLAWSGVTRDLAWVHQRTQQWQPTARERRWENIGWAKDLREALHLASVYQRPVFLFTQDGHLNVGRC